VNGCGQCNFNILFLKCADKTIHDVSFSILNQIDGLAHVLFGSCLPFCRGERTIY